MALDVLFAAVTKMNAPAQTYAIQQPSAEILLVALSASAQRVEYHFYKCRQENGNVW